MIAIKVEIWPFGEKREARTIGRMYIANDGSGTRETGNYIIKVTDGSEQELESGFEFRGLKATSEIKVKSHSRASGFWPIVKRAIDEMIKEKNEKA